MARIAAWEVLRSGSPTPMRLVDPVADRAGLDGRDRALVRRLVGTALRRRGSLLAITSLFARGKPKADVAVHLHLGLVQLLFMDRIPNHAAVGETSEAAARTIGRSKVPYVNGILRNVLRARHAGTSGDPRCDLIGRELHFEEPVFRDPELHPLLWAEDALSIPAQLYKRWLKRYGGTRTRALAETFLEEAPLSVRVVCGEPGELRAELEGVDFAETSHPRILLAPSGATEAVVNSAAFRAGRATVQGGHALAAAELVGAAPGMRILDLCASPGGKTAVLAASGADVLATDLDAGRLARLGETLERLGALERVERRESDGTGAVPESEFDAVLVDAPCSNTGVLGARPAARWRFGPRTQKELVALQGRLLREGAAKVKPGGRLVWSTCSLEPDENGGLVDHFLAEQPGWQRAGGVASLPDSARGPGDGGEAILLVRS